MKKRKRLPVWKRLTWDAIKTWVGAILIALAFILPLFFFYQGMPDCPITIPPHFDVIAYEKNTAVVIEPDTGSIYKVDLRCK